MANAYKTKLDIKNVTPSFKPVFVQYDHARLEIELMDNGEPYDLSDVSKAEFTHVRPDNLPIIYPGEIVTNGTKKIIRYIYQGSEMDIIGMVEASFAVFDSDNNKVSSHSFFVEIKKDLRDETFEPANPSFGKLQTLIDDVEDLKANGGGGGIGLQGPKGDKGDTGDPGPIGPQGLRGEQGPKGDKGDVGETGPQGLKGEKGDIGPQGIQGIQGLKGDTGPQGPPGSDANITAHENSAAPHQYGGVVEWRHNPTTNSLDLVWLSP